jgi:hypothetical protein
MSQDVKSVGTLYGNPFQRAIFVDGSTQIHGGTIDFGGYDAAIDAQQGC